MSQIKDLPDPSHHQLHGHYPFACNMVFPLFHHHLSLRRLYQLYHWAPRNSGFQLAVVKWRQWWGAMVGQGEQGGSSPSFLSFKWPAISQVLLLMTSAPLGLCSCRQIPSLDSNNWLKYCQVLVHVLCSFCDHVTQDDLKLPTQLKAALKS